MAQVEMPKTGKLISYTFLYESMTGFEEIIPLPIGLIELDNGVRLISQIADSNQGELGIGDRVTAVFRKIKSNGAGGILFYGYKFIRDSERL